jgi:Integral membrane protein CcmA involved in cell shape determination
MMGNRNKSELSTGNGIHNSLAVGSTVKGDIVLDIDLRLDGCVEGNIICASKIVIGPKGRVIGNIESANVEVAGTVTGNIHAKEKLTLKSSANIEGDLHTKILEIELNAKLNGRCNMSKE